jgi:hypothetical protein
MSTDKLRRGDHLPPDYEHFIHALRSVGYSFEESVADIIDNSLDAGASHVSVRFVVREDKSVDLLIADNGNGMDEEALREAMVFGTQPVAAHQKRLGKFGLGLKMASIAQAMNVHVVSNKDGKISGRVWSDMGLKQGFFCEILSPDEITSITKLSTVPSEQGHGTWVLWEYLHRYASEFERPEVLCTRIISGLLQHLGMHFHRFLAKDKFGISIEVVNHEGVPGVRRAIQPYDPFGYEKSGSDGFPAEFQVDAGSSYSGKLKIKGHIWPPKSNSPNYKLPGGAVKRQGLYFYRNNRLISGGGWFDIKEGLDTHDSLGRVEIELENLELEREVSLDIRKALVKVTPALRDAIKNSKTESGVTFAEYLKAVNKTYRSANAGKKKIKGKTVQVASGQDGIASLVNKLLAAAQREEALARVKWGSLDKAEENLFFSFDEETGECTLNERFRSLFLPAVESGGGEALVRTFFLLLLSGFFDKSVFTDDDRDFMGGLSGLLAESAGLSSDVLPPGEGQAK